MNEKRAQRAIERSIRECEGAGETPFRGAFDHAPIGMALAGPDGRWMRVNRAFCKIVGYAEEELSGRSVQWFIHPDDAGENRERYRRLAAGESDSFSVEERLFHKDRRIVWTELSVAVVRGAGEEPLYFIAQIQDITERKRIGEGFRQSEERFRQLTENITEVFWMTNPEKNEILYVSPGYEKIWGRSCESAYERPAAWLDAVHPDDRERVAASARLQESGRYDEEFRIIRPDGSVRWIRDRAFPVKDRSGQVYRITGIAEDITERKRTAEALEKSEERLRMAIGAARMYIWDFDLPTGRLIRSGHYQEVYGSDLPSSDISFTAFLQMIYSEDRKKIEQTLDRSLREKASCRVDFRVVRPDGEVRWLETQGQSYCDAAGNVVRMTGVTQDITERKRAEEARQASEERFRRYFEMGLVGMAVTSPAKGCIEVNDRLCEILGYSRNELLRMSWVDLTHPEDIAMDLAHFNRVISREIDAYSIDKRFIRKDGEVIHATISVNCLRHADGSVEAFMALLQDITERKQAEARLAYQANLLTHVGDAILATAARIVLTAWNLAAEKIYGWKAEEVLGRPVRDVVRSERNDDQRSTVLQAIAETGRYQTEVVHMHKDGKKLDIQGYTMVLRDEAGRITGYVSANRDITRRKRAEEALENYAGRLQSLSGQLLEAQETERRRIARELHDEIGQSLTAIKMQLYAQRHSKKDLPVMDECIQIVNQALSQVRDLSLDLHPPQLDELGLVATLRWHLDRQVKAAKLVPRFSADRLPDRLRPDIEIACFRVAQEALTNVIRHAGAKEVSVELRRRGGELHLIVGDDGRGFDVEAARDRAVQGASLGLIGMTERVELAGGRLAWRSAPGEGTQLHVVFPLTHTASRKRPGRRKL